MIQAVFEILKNLFAKDFINLIFHKHFRSVHKLIKVYGKSLISLIVLILIIIATSHITNFLKGNIWNRSTRELAILKEKSEKAVERLFKNCKDRNKKCDDHFMISLIFIECQSDDSVTFRWLDMQGFNEGNIFNFNTIVKQNEKFKPTNIHKANKNDNCQIILDHSETNKTYTHDERESSIYLETHKNWIENQMTNYPINNIYYYIQPFALKKGFIMLQISTVNRLIFLEQKVYNDVFEELKENLKNQILKNNFKISNDIFYH
jgi:hypothetical protein